MTQALARHLAPSSHLENFSRDGFVGPLRLFDRADAAALRLHLSIRHPAPMVWGKGRAVADRLIYDLAVMPQLLGPMRDLLGPNVILWGANVISRKPGSNHPWHTDVESSPSDGRFASAWIGIANTNQASAIQLIPCSHRYGKSLQQVAHEVGGSRGAARDTVLGWARTRDRHAKILELDVSDGEAVIFDGRLWHGSDNRTPDERLAVLLQYAAADMPVRIPESFEWPFHYRSLPLPPVIAVSGSAKSLSTNRLVAPPAKAGRKPMVTSCIHRLKLPLSQDPERGWKPHRMFRGPTRILDEMGVHASILDPGCCPHPPHVHPEEELLMVLDGEAEIVLADDPVGTNMRVQHGRPGTVFYYPPQQHHTIRNAASRPVTYLMFKWRAGSSGALDQLDATNFNYGSGDVPEGPKGYKTAKIFEQPTQGLNKLQSHLTTMLSSAGYEPHVDAYDVAILTLRGRVETLGQVVEPHSVIFYSAGEAHGMRNVGEDLAEYLVFEFHGQGASAPPNAFKDIESERALAKSEKRANRLEKKLEQQQSKHERKLEQQQNRYERKLEQQKKSFEKRLDEKRSAIKSSKDREMMSRKKAASFETQLAAVVNSSSWRITAPLRALLDFAKGVLKP